jgi:hypothetical protein
MGDSRPHFDVKVSLPYDARFAETVRLLVVQAAQSAGSDVPVAEAFGHTVVEALRGVKLTGTNRP